jgi:hypothetical protein
MIIDIQKEYKIIDSLNPDSDMKKMHKIFAIMTGDMENGVYSIFKLENADTTAVSRLFSLLAILEAFIGMFNDLEEIDYLKEEYLLAKKLHKKLKLVLYK